MLNNKKNKGAIGMQINVRTHHVAITQALKDYAYKKMEKLEKYFDNIQEILIELNIISTADENKSQEVAVTVILKGNKIRASQTNKDMYAGIDLVYDKLEKQLVKYKEKIKFHKKENPVKTFLDGIMPKKNEKKINSNISHKDKHFHPKPITIDFAIKELKAKNLAFLVFRNAENKEINVIYLTEDNDINLIET